MIANKNIEPFFPKGKTLLSKNIFTHTETSLIFSALSYNPGRLLTDPMIRDSHSLEVVLPVPVCFMF